MPKTLLAAALALLAFATAPAEIVPANFDPAVKPQDNFYLHVNGTWIKTVQIPPDYSRWAAFDQLIERNQENLRVLCERATAQSDETTPDEKRVSDFYASGMDSGQANAIGTIPLQFEFDRIDGLASPADILAELAHLNALGVNAGFSFSSNPDMRDSNTVIAEIDQGGLGLPNRDYYFRTDAKSQELRAQYIAHIGQMLQLLGENADMAHDGAVGAMKIEMALAAGSLTPVQLRDPAASYHKVNLAEAAGLFPGVAWPDYFAKTEAPAFTVFNLAHPEFIKAFAAALAKSPLADWQGYLRWQFLNAYAPYLSDEFANAHFEFYGKILTGAKRIKPRWKRVVTTIDGCIGDALGRLYVDNFFPGDAKARALKLVEDLRTALRARLETLEWMDAPTRTQALAKLDALTVKIAYPDKWRDYHSLIIDRGPFVLNVLKSNAFEVRRQLKKIGGPVDRSEWQMSAPTVNAYYDPQHNEIVFPAGILQPPFFDAKASDPVNYGAIGAIIGHEMTHGFDDEGRQFDAHGNLSDWWSPQSAEKFKALGGRIVTQFSAYHVFPDLALNGELTEGENIADLGGVKIAYAAMEKALGDGPHAADGNFTPEQSFFISFASCWAVKYRPEALRLLVQTNPHSPGEFRCNGPLSNLDEFAAAFHVPEGAPMRRPAAARVTIW